MLEVGDIFSVNYWICNLNSNLLPRKVVSNFSSFRCVLACEQALLGVGGRRGKEERACNDVSGVFISASKKSTQNADWWILNLVLSHYSSRASC